MLNIQQLEEVIELIGQKCLVSFSKRGIILKKSVSFE